MTGPLYVVWCTGMRGPELVTCVDEFSIAVDIARRSAPAATRAPQAKRASTRRTCRSSGRAACLGRSASG